MCRHFDLFLLGVQILLSSSIGGGGGFFWDGPENLSFLRNVFGNSQPTKIPLTTICVWNSVSFYPSMTSLENYKRPVTVIARHKYAICSVLAGTNLIVSVTLSGAHFSGLQTKLK